MASHRQPGPLGLNPSYLRCDGTLARCAPPTAGVTGSIEAIGRGAAGDAIASTAASLIGPGTVMMQERVRWISDWTDVRMARQPGFVHIALSGEREGGCQRIVIRTYEMAEDVATRLAQDPIGAAALKVLSSFNGRRLISWTAGQLGSGNLKLLWRQREQQSYAPIDVPAPPPAPVQRHRPAPSGPSPAYATFPPELDAAAVAQSLKAAAQDGVPFCEECRKAQEARDRASGEAA